MCVKSNLGLLTRSQALFLLVIIVVSSANGLNAQFTDISVGLPNTGLYGWVDLDKDGDLDLYRIQSGSTRFLINNGNDVFTDLGIQLMGRINQESFGDCDNDGDIDIITGYYSSQDYRSILYRNDGNNLFTMVDYPFPQAYSNPSWGDLDNDGDIDMLLTENTSVTDNREVGTILYRNDRNSMFFDLEADIPGCYGTTTWGDFDNDGDLDILLLGIEDPMAYPDVLFARFYRNDGTGAFTLIESGLPCVLDKPVLGDYDNDGDLDILLCGRTDPWGDQPPITEVYRNDGDFVFSPINAGLLGVGYNSNCWGDYDNDGDSDLLLSGYVLNNGQDGTNYVWTGRTKIYRNDGLDVFTEVPYGLPNVGGSALWGDYDNDGDIDIVMSGRLGYSEIVKIFRNDVVVGNNSPATPANLSATVSRGSILISWSASTDDHSQSNSISYNLRVGTVDNPDLIMASMSGSDGGLQIPTYGNTGSGLFHMVKNLPPNQNFIASVQAIDQSYKASPFSTSVSFTSPGVSVPEPTVNIYPEDDAMLIVSGNIILRWNRTESNTGDFAEGYLLYLGLGSDGFNIESGLDLGDVTSFAIPQNYIRGHSEYFWRIVPYNSAGQALGCPIWSFTIDSDWVEDGDNLIDLGSGALDWGDFDNDGDLDLGMIGSDSNWEPRLHIYRNDGNEGFFAIQHSIQGLMGNSSGSFKWGDYDNDGDLDFLMAGLDSQWEPRLIICKNNNSTFQVLDTNMQGIQSGCVLWGDLDNDGDLDIFVTGEYQASSTQYVSKIYVNEGNDVFSDSDIQLQTGFSTSADLGDYDKDGDLDIMQTGCFYEDGSSSPIYATILYVNNGYFDFTETVTNIVGLSSGAIRMCDLDNDGDLDVIGTGSNPQGRKVFVYRNDITSFTAVNVMEQGVCYGDIDLGDYDNDGDMDILLSGNSMLPPYDVTMIIENNGGFTFNPLATSIQNLPSTSSISWGDFDGDGDLDIAGMGGNSFDPSISVVYRNDLMISNQAPTPPVVTYELLGSVIFSATNSIDDATPQNAIHYNYRIGSISDESDVVSPMSLDSGKRLVCAYGNSYSGRRVLDDLAPGSQLYASVQALDNSYYGSSFSPEFSLTLPDLELVYPNGGELLTAGELSYISWNDNSVRELYLEISPDNGVTWQLIVSTPVLSAPGVFEFTVPDIVSSRCLARISWAKDTTSFDVSDLNFSISNHTESFAELSEVSLQFGNVWNNHIATKNIEIRNIGLQPLEVSLLLGAGAFSVSTTDRERDASGDMLAGSKSMLPQRVEITLSIPAMSSQTVYVNFMPTASQNYSRNLFIETNAPNLPSAIVPLSGTGYNLYAEFATIPNQGDVPLTVEFQNQSVNGISSCLWDFGDGTTSTEMNPSHTFTTEGGFDVMLTVWDQYFNTSVTHQVTVIAHPLITCEQISGHVFNKTYVDEISAPFSILLQSSGTDTLFVTNAYWMSQQETYFQHSFGDIAIPIIPGEALSLDVNFAPLMEGVFSDTLCIVNNSENHPILKIPFSGRGYTLHAGYTADPASGDVPLTVSFTDTSTEDIIQWGWNFGDGNTSTEQNPVHEFDTEGEYSVELTVSDGTHFDTISQNIVVIAHPSLSSEQLTGHQFSKTYLNETSAPFEIILNSTGSDTLLVSNVYWKSRHRDSYFHYTYAQLNDPIIPGGYFNVNVSFAPLTEGVFADTLCVVNNSENLPLLEIPFSGRGYLLHAVFSTNPETGDVPLTVTFADQSTEDIIQWNWDFMDGNTSTLHNPVHTFQVEGVYPVTLTVSDGVHFDSVSHNITVIAHPLLEWNEEPSFNFGVVYLSDVSPMYTISIYNSGTDSLYIEDIRWKDSRQEFHFNCDILNQPILPGNYGSVNVWFEPIIQGNFSDSLFIETNAENIPFINVKFSGVGEYVPPLPPENVSISMNGHHAIISWNTVNQNIYGFPFSPDYYIVSYNGSSDPENGQYYFLALTPELTLTHPNVGLHADNMFYRVRAYKYYGRGVNEIAKLLRPGMPEEEALNILSSFE